MRLYVVLVLFFLLRKISLRQAIVFLNKPIVQIQNLAIFSLTKVVTHQIKEILPVHNALTVVNFRNHCYCFSESGAQRNFDVYFTDIETPGFREYHERLQSFIKFYIDAASYIDVDDPQWDYYLL